LLLLLLSSTGLDWSSVMLTLHHDEVSQSKWWQVDEVVTGSLLDHELNTTSSVSSSTSPSPEQASSTSIIVINPFLSIVSFSERVPTGVLSIFDNYGSVTARLLTYLFQRHFPVDCSYRFLPSVL